LTGRVPGQILILTGDAAESLEVMYPYQRLLEEGVRGAHRRALGQEASVRVHDFVDGYDTYTEKAGYTWPADIAFADVDPADYVALVIPGGRAPEYIRNDADVQRIVQHLMNASSSRSCALRRPLIHGAAGTCFT
jgi:protease I